MGRKLTLSYRCRNYKRKNAERERRKQLELENSNTSDVNPESGIYPLADVVVKEEVDVEVKQECAYWPESEEPTSSTTWTSPAKTSLTLEELQKEEKKEKPAKMTWREREILKKKRKAEQGRLSKLRRRERMGLPPPRPYHFGPKTEEEAALSKLKRRERMGLPPSRPYRFGPKTEEEMQARKDKNKFYGLMRRLRLPEEQKQKERERRKQFSYFYYRAKPPMTKEEKEKKNIRQKNRIANFTPEQKAQHREQLTRGHRKMRQKWKEQCPEKYQKFIQSMTRYQQKILATETPEQRQQRLLYYRINQKKKKLKTQLENDGVHPEEIERRVNALVEQMRSEPLPPPSEYKPKPRKNKKNSSLPLTTPLVVAGPSPFISLHPSSSQGLVPSLPSLSMGPSFVSCEPSASNGFPFVPSAPSSSLSLQNEPLCVASPSDSPGHDDYSFDDPPGPSSPCFQDMPVLPVVEYEYKMEVTPSLPPTPPPTRRRGRPPKNKPVVSSPVSLSTLHTLDPNTTRLRINESEEDKCFSALRPQSQLPPANLVLSTMGINVPTATTSFSETNTTASVGEELILPEMCEECGETFKSHMSYIIHKSKAHTDYHQASLTCPKCSTLCTTNEDLREHFAKFHTVSTISTIREDTHISDNLSQQQSTANQKLNPQQRYVGGTDQHQNLCMDCGKVFRQKATLDDHIRRVHQGQGFYCDVCGAECQSRAKVWRHQVERHGMSDLPPPEGVVATNCKYCGDVVFRGYEAHVRKRHPEHFNDFVKNIPVAKCRDGRILKDGPGSLQEIVKCPHCDDDESMTLKMFKRHIRAKHSIPCAQCGKLYVSLTDLDYHYKMTHGLKDIEKKLEVKKLIRFKPNGTTAGADCLICNASMTLRNEIRAHFESAHHHIVQELIDLSCPSIKCELCEEVRFITEIELQAHIVAAHPDKSYTCPYCGMFKRTQVNLKKHIKAHFSRTKNNLNRRKAGSCFICKKDFRILKEGQDPTTISNKVWSKCMVDLERHVEQEHPTSFFRCPNCPKWCYDEPSLRSHSSWCFQRDKSKEMEIGLHVQKEKKEKLNGKSQYIRNTLTKMKILCRECHCVYSLRSMKEHMESVHGIKQHAYQCEHCPMSFRRYESWVAHVEWDHEIPLEEIVLIPGPDNSRRTRTKSSKIRDDRNEALLDSGNKLKTRRKAPKRTKTEPVEVDQYADLEKDKRLVIYVYPLTEEDMKPYIKKIQIDLERM